ncbi:MAG: transglutaminase domain-containing protein [Solirubrobacteraceae bacterium]
MSLFASLEYAGLLSRPPVARLLGLVALVTLGGGVLALLGGAARPRRRADAVAATLLTLVLALLAVGVPAQLLAPDGWVALGRHVGHGVGALGPWLWPYTGHDPWAARAVLLVLPVVLTVAAALCFWPARTGRSGGARRGAALLLLVALYLAGVANTAAHLDGLRGLVLVTLVAAWLWLPGLRVADAPRAARWLLAGALVALMLRPLLSSPSSWIDYREGNAQAQLTASFQWDQLYGPVTWPRTAATMLEVHEPRPTLLRVTSLDRFDGLRFLRSATPPGSRSLDLPRRYADAVRIATITIAGLRSSLLVSGGGVAGSARWLGVGAPPLRREADGTLRAPATVGGGALYQVSSYAPARIPARLRAAARVFPRRYLPYAQFELPDRGASGLPDPKLRLDVRAQPRVGTLVGPARPGARPGADAITALRIAESPYAGMFALAQRLARGARSDYDIAVRIQRFLLANYAYSEHVAQARYPLEAFLFTQRAGYCQQFSGAMTLMLRMDGVPARVGAGFKPVVHDPRTGGWRVRALDAHSWVEVFFAGTGWVAFDPTPQAPPARAGSAGAPSKAVVDGGSTPRRRAAPKLQVGALRVAAPRTRAGFPLLPAALGLCGLIALALLRRAWLSGRARLDRGVAGGADGAAGELTRALAVLARGHAEKRPGAARCALTLAGLERQLRGRGRQAAADYVAALEAVRYGPPGEAARPSRRGRAALRRALAAQAGARAALRVFAQMPPGGAGRV